MINFEAVTKQYPDGTVAVDELSLEVPTGSLLVLVGPSGCGKTTSLRMINRLIEPTSGRITLEGLDILSVDKVSLRRRIGYVIQHAGLFPHRTIVDNVAALPRLLGGDKASTKAKAMELLELVGLDSRFAKRYPWQLSGGQQQRVGVARALATDPPFLLMDEPFSAVDPIVRAQLQQEFLKLQASLGKTIVMVTHDIDEALTLGDRIAVLRAGGVLAQVGTPSELLTAPADAFVAEFVGAARGYRALGFRGLGTGSAPEVATTVKLGAPTPKEWAVVLDANEQPLGWVDGRQHERAEPAAFVATGVFLPATANLRELMEGALVHPEQLVGVTGADGHLLGSYTAEAILAAGRAKS